MSKILNKKVLSVIALALVCVFAGTVIGGSQPSASAEEKVVLTSPFTEAIAKVRDSVVGVNNYQIVNNNYSNGYDNFGGYFPWSYFGGFGNGYGNYEYSRPESSEEVKYGSGSAPQSSYRLEHSSMRPVGVLNPSSPSGRSRPFSYLRYWNGL